MEENKLIIAETFDGNVSCSCCEEASLKKFPVAMAYVPFQQWRNIYKPDCALDMGTIFKELYKPFMGRGVN